MDFSQVRSCLLLVTLVALSANADLSGSYMNGKELANEADIEDMLVHPLGSVSHIEQHEDAHFKPSSSGPSLKAMCAVLKLGAEQTDNNDDRESYQCLIEQSCTPKGKQQENRMQAGLCKYISTLNEKAAAWMKAYQEENCKETSSMAEEIDMDVNYSSKNASQDAEKESVECYPLTPAMQCELYELGRKGNFKKTTRKKFRSKFNRFCSTQGKEFYCNQIKKTLDLDPNLKDHLFKGPQQHLFSIYADFCLPEEKQDTEEAIASLAQASREFSKQSSGAVAESTEEGAEDGGKELAGETAEKGHLSNISNIAIKQRNLDMKLQVYRQKKEKLTKEVEAYLAELQKLDSEWAAYERMMEP